MPELVPVRVRDCACPDLPHAEEGDIVYLRPTLPLRGGAVAERNLVEAQGDPDGLMASWLETFVRYGADGWNWLDDQGEPLPFDVQVLLDDWGLSRPVADRAAELYQESVLSPFQNASTSRSPTGRTAGSTSRTRGRTNSSPS